METIKANKAPKEKVKTTKPGVNISIMANRTAKINHIIQNFIGNIGFYPKTLKTVSMREYLCLNFNTFLAREPSTIQEYLRYSHS